MADLFLLLCLITMGCMAESYRQQRNTLKGEVEDLEDWIDEIVTALTEKDDEMVDHLVVNKSDA